ncbi:MAG: response regulator [Halobacteriovoraceae bacterium]|jgi:HD-GYP domain-containing protein (c-di-GMP phosphodiesterase class II)|nr:response regulator [Halobacteriovoraceae bacterium]
MKVLIVDDYQDIRDVIELALSCEFDGEFIHAESGIEAIELLKENKDFDFMTCDYHMPNGGGDSVYQYLLNANDPTPFVFCSSVGTEENDVFKNTKNLLLEIAKPLLIEGLEKLIILLQEKGILDEQVEIKDDKRIKITLDLLLKFNKFPCDIYVEIGNEKELKIFNTGDEFSKAEYDKYTDKGITHFLINKQDAQKYVRSICDDITKILTNKNLSDEDKIHDTHAVILSTIKDLGLSEKIIRAAQNSVDFTLDVFEKNNKLNDFERHIFSDKDCYLTAHSVGVSLISVALLTKTPWDSPATRNKLVLAGFLHDATIKSLNFDEMHLEGNEHLRTHPIEASEILKLIKSFPPDVDRILQEHHEKSDGSGYPKGISVSNIHSLSCVFIFAHDLIDHIFRLKKEGDAITDDILRSVIDKEKYQMGGFKKVYQAFLEISLFK